MALIYNPATGGVQNLPPTGNLLPIGLFTGASGLAIPASATVVQTSGYATQGVGSARYAQTINTGATIYRFQSADGRWFELAEPEPYLEMLGAVADNQTVITSIFQTALNTFRVINMTAHESGAKYMIDNSLTMPDTVWLKGNGASIQAAATMTGTLLTEANYFVMGNDCVMDGVNIVPPAGTYSLDTNYHSVIRMTGSRGILRNGSIDQTGSSLADAIEGFRVTGAVDGNIIQSMKLTGCAANYGDLGARGTLVKNFESYNSPSNALGGGATDSAREAYGHVIDGFYIVNPGRMGIEDQCRAHVSGTTLNPTPSISRNVKICNGTIIGSGTPAFFAISAVSISPSIENVMILNWPTTLAIELVANYGGQVISAHVEWTDGNPNAVTAIQNEVPPNVVGTTVPAFGGGFATAGQPYNLGRPVKVTSSTVIGATDAIHNRARGALIVIGGSFIDYTSHGITTEVANAENYLTVEGALFILSQPNTAQRIAILSAGAYARLKGNTVRWLATATGGVGQEVGTQIIGDKTQVEGNHFDNTSNITAGTLSPVAVTTSGGTPAKAQILNNTTASTGTVRMVLTGMTTPRYENNDPDFAVSSPGLAVFGPYSSAGAVKGTLPVAATDPTSTQTLANALRTMVIAQGQSN